MWQPIETAPKDRRILLFFPYVGAIVGKWEPDKHSKRVRPFWTCDREFQMGRVQTRTYQPTHWMPLPEPPPK